MRANDLYENLSGVDEAMIAEAAPNTEPVRKPRKTFQWLAAAACFGLVLSAILIGVPMIKKENSQITTDHIIEWNDTRPKKNHLFLPNEKAYVFPWEYLTTEEKFGTVIFQDREYGIAGKVKDKSSLASIGESIGRGTAYGQDRTGDQKQYTQDCRVFSVQNTDASRIIWVNFDGDDSYYVYSLNEYQPPLNLSAFLDSLNFTEYISLTYFAEADNEPRYALSPSDTATFWNLLKSMKDAELVEAQPQKSIGFRIDSDILGIHNLSLSVSKDGYLSTNAERYGYSFFIGEESAADIIGFLEKSSRTPYQPTNGSIVGKIVEIGDGFIKVDDSIMMENPEDGLVFTVMTDSLTVKRYVDSGLIGVGDTVQIDHGGITKEKDSLIIRTATDIHKGQISDGDILIPE